MPEERKVYRRPARTAAPAPQAGQTAPRPDAPPPPKKKKRPGAKRRRSRLVLGLCLLCLLVVVVVSVVLVRCSAEEGGPAEADFGTPAAAWQKNDLGYYFNTSGRAMPAAVLKGMDVSKFQGEIDWEKAKAAGIDFAIIRCGYRGYGSGALVEDSTYRRNIQGAINAGLRVGVYFYSQAINEAEAVEEASMVLSLVSGYSLPLGVYYDTESVGGGRANALSAAERTACAVAFCETIRSAGYSAGVYSYASWFYNALNFANISKYNIWIAQYRDTLSFSYKHNIWQYTGSGSVKGISKPVDMNIG